MQGPLRSDDIWMAMMMINGMIMLVTTTMATMIDRLTERHDERIDDRQHRLQ